MHWTIYASLSAIFAALVAVLGKIGLKDVDSTLATSIRAVVMAVFLVIVAVSLGKFSNVHAISNKALTFIVFSGIAGAMSWIFYFFALKVGPTSGVSAIDKMSTVFVLVLAVLFLGESLTWLKALGALAMTVGAVLMIW